MSAASENRWRQPISSSQNRQQQPPSNRDRSDRGPLSGSSGTQQQRAPRIDSSTTTVAASSSSSSSQQQQQQQQQAPRENAWNTDRSRSHSSNARGTTGGARGGGGGAGVASAGVGGNVNSGGSGSGSGAGPGLGPVEEKHVPAGGFNGEEIREFLRKSFADGIAGDAENKAIYHPSSDAGNSSSSTTNSRPAWGSKPSAMANGQDFWVQLKKQITALEQGRGG